MKISHCEPSSLKAWVGLGPGNSTAKNSLLRKPLKLAPSTASLPTLALLLCIFCPEPFPELLDAFSACFFFYEKAVEGLLLLLYPNSNSLLYVRHGPCPWHVGFWILQGIMCPHHQHTWGEAWMGTSLSPCPWSLAFLLGKQRNPHSITGRAGINMVVA